MAKSNRPPAEEVRRRPKDDDDAPRKARKQDDDDEGDDELQKPRKKRKSAAGPVRLILRICACVAGGIMLIILLYWVYTPVGTDYALLCYFPPETSRLSGYDVDECSRNAKLKDVHETLLSNYKQFSEKRFSQDAGVGPNDVDKYLSGTASGDPEEEKNLDPQDRRGSLTVIRFKNSVDQAKFIASFTGAYKAEEKQARDGKVYHQLWTQRWVTDHFERAEDISFFFPNSRTLVYATTRKEIQEAMTRQPGKIVINPNMRDLADKVDGHYFQASSGWIEMGGIPNTMAYGLSFVEEDLRDPMKFVGVTGSASWFASNGNDFLYASATQYGDAKIAKDVRQRMRTSFDKAQAEAYASQSGTPGGLEDPFNPKQPKQAGGPGGGGFGGGGGGSNEQSKDILEALAEYSRTARVYRRGRMVVVEGTISHGMPEQGRFEKFWAAVGSKFRFQQQGFGPGMGMPGGGMPGGPGMPMGPGMPGPGMPMGPGMPGPGRP